MNPLATYTTEQLKREIARRERKPKRERGFRPCDECQHFNSGDLIESPCKKGQSPKFRTPEGDDFITDNWGYHLHNCPDRKEIE